MIKTKKIISWLDNNILLLLSGFLIAFIPLYPKIPLADLVPGYIVRLRLEDLFVFFAAFVWFVQVLRGKIKWRSIIFWLMVAYLIIGLLSVISAAFLLPSMPLELLHISKSVLHWLRYIEYFVLFVLTFSAVKTKKDVQILMSVFVFTTLAIVIYGYGQRFHYWPVFSTMNREFSKGVRLYLTENARVQSTFAGHYDLAAYLVIVLNLILAIAYKQAKNWKKIWFHLVHLLGLWLLVMTASRTSFAAYIAGAAVVIFLIASEQPTFLAKLKWGVSRFVLILLLIGIMMLQFGDDMQDRFLHVLRGYPQAEQTYQAFDEWQKNTTNQVKIALNLKDPKKSKDKPDNWIAVDNTIDEVLTETDERPSSDKPDRTRPDDVYVDVPVTTRVATQSADGTTKYTSVKTERTWSENAMKYGLSVAIRLDTLWPNAIQGFKHNPLLGKGYGTLNKETFHHFTEAESTDNNFLRILGETGLLGFISFYSIIAVALFFAYKFHQVDRTYTSAVSIGFIGATIGLLVNALYIDVFAASKVAFSYWALTGLVIALYYLDQNKKLLNKTVLMTKYQKFTEKIETKLRR
jgi:hypothetical protein